LKRSLQQLLSDTCYALSKKLGDGIIREGLQADTVGEGINVAIE
jgi:hypothetical protein